ncbi:MAG: hypothetical protein CSA72_11890 [Rhodobacterales bacterium]|nr:MAG: hypothetical protein CSA72_11890 [Rhodobacterales bacterium]
MNTTETGGTAPAESAQRFYFAAWRWHFYAGLFVIPFLLMLTITGFIMQVDNGLSNQLGYAPRVEVKGEPLPPSTLGKAALEEVPGQMIQYVTPEADNRAAFFVIRNPADAKPGMKPWEIPAKTVAVDPYTAEIVSVNDKTKTVYAWANDIHGTLLLGTTGDRIIEAAVSLTLLLIATGLYMWWPRDRGALSALVPNLTKRGRALFKELHVIGGVWVSVFLLLFVLSGLAWAGVWGGKFVQPWSSFPAEKKAKAWSSDITHASLNQGPLDEVPWGLELTPMPVSGTSEGDAAIPQPVTLDTVVMWAQANGFEGQYKVALPTGDTGVYTVMRSSQSEDSVAPSQDRTVHFDRYTGNRLADIGYADYSLMAKAMAQGIALHKGLAGTWNYVLNLVLLAVIFMVNVTGVIMWWKRRPTGAMRLAAPPLPRDLPMWKGAILVALALSMAFPMAGISLLAVIAIDTLILVRVPALKRAFS